MITLPLLNSLSMSDRDSGKLVVQCRWISRSCVGSIKEQFGMGCDGVILHGASRNN